MIENLHTKWFNEHLDEIESFIRNTLSSKVVEGSSLVVLHSDGNKIADSKGNNLGFIEVQDILNNSSNNVILLYKGSFILNPVYGSNLNPIRFIGLSIVESNISVSLVELNNQGLVSSNDYAGLGGGVSEEYVKTQINNTFRFNERTKELIIVTK